MSFQENSGLLLVLLKMLQCHLGWFKTRGQMGKVYEV